MNKKTIFMVLIVLSMLFMGSEAAAAVRQRHHIAPLKPASVQSDFWAPTTGVEGCWPMGVTAVSATDAWLLFGWNPYHFDGTSWTLLRTGLPDRNISGSSEIISVVAAPNGDIYARVGWNDNKLYRFVSGTWTALPGALPSDWQWPLFINPVDNSPYTATYDGVYHFTGSAWEQLPGLSEGSAAIAFRPNGHLIISVGSGVKEYLGSGVWLDLSAPVHMDQLAVAPDGVVFGTTGLAFYKYESGAWLNTYTFGGSYYAVQFLGCASGHIYADTWTDLYRSDDHGMTWTPLSVRTVLIKANMRKAVTLFGDDGIFCGTRSYDIVSSTDNGTNWTLHNTGLAFRYIVSIALIPSDNHIVCADDQRSFLSTDDGLTWTSGGTGLHQWDNPKMGVIQKDGIDYIFCSGDGITRSTDEGATWSDFNDGFGDLETNQSLCFPTSGAYAGKVLVGTYDGIYYADPDGTTWTLLASVDVMGDGPAYRIIVKDDGTMLAFMPSAVLASTDDGLTWTSFGNPPDGFGGEDFSPLLITPEGSYIASAGGVIQRSKDNCASWEYVAYANMVSSIIQTADGALYAATDLGVLKSTDDGTTWLPLNSGLPINDMANVLEFTPAAHLLAGMSGSSVWRSVSTVIQQIAITGRLVDDAMVNCNPAQDGLSGWLVEITPGPLYVSTDINGNYAVTGLVPGTYTVRPVAPAGRLATCPAATQSIVYTGTKPVTDVDFWFARIPDITDLQIGLGGEPARPGKPKVYGITYQNRGSTSIDNVQVFFQLPPHVTYVSSTPPDNDHSSAPIRWDLGTLDPGSSGTIVIVTQIDAAPDVKSGDVLTASAWITPSAGDATPANNYCADPETVDTVNIPFRKSLAVLSGGSAEILRTTDSLRYHIDFQNNTDWAVQNIIVQDTIDADLDLATFAPGTSPYPYTLSVNEQRIVTFVFPNIYLPGRLDNESMSHAFVEYSILPRSGVPGGTAITNSAIMYLDLNPPSATNMVASVIGVSETLHLAARWNMVSNPFTGVNDSVAAFFPHAVSPAFYYAADGYHVSAVLPNGPGYFLKSDIARDVPFFAGPLTTLTIPLITGWNLIGSVDGAVPVVSIPTTPAGIIISPFYSYSGGYTASSFILPGKGYWVKTSGPGQLTLTASAGGLGKPVAADIDQRLADLAPITITDAEGHEQRLYAGRTVTKGLNGAFFELPPPLPNGEFDARYASGRIAEFLGVENVRNIPVNIASAAYPVTLSWSVRPDAGLSLAVLIDGKETILSSEGKVKIASAANVSISIGNAAAGAELPKEFALRQNYPNPFNPSTSIRYELPSDCRVTLTVYTLLGQQVATIVDGEQTAGFKEAVWNASDCASGMYVYRLDATALEGGKHFSQSRKVVLVK